MEIVGIIIAVLVIAYFVKNNSSSKSTTTPKATPKATTTTTTVADKNANGITSKAELKTLTKMQLLELAEKQNLKVKKSGTKAAVINEIHSQMR
jgi:hypothetical protein